MWNNRFMVRMAEHLADRAKGDPNQLAQWVLGRPASNDERDYAAKHSLSNLARVLLNTNEFLFVD